MTKMSYKLLFLFSVLVLGACENGGIRKADNVTTTSSSINTEVDDQNTDYDGDDNHDEDYDEEGDEGENYDEHPEDNQESITYFDLDASRVEGYKVPSNLSSHVGNYIGTLEKEDSYGKKNIEIIQLKINPDGTFRRLRKTYDIDSYDNGFFVTDYNYGYFDSSEQFNIKEASDTFNDEEYILTEFVFEQGLVIEKYGELYLAEADVDTAFSVSMYGQNYLDQDGESNDAMQVVYNLIANGIVNNYWNGQYMRFLPTYEEFARVVPDETYLQNVYSVLLELPNFESPQSRFMIKGDKIVPGEKSNDEIELTKTDEEFSDLLEKPLSELMTPEVFEGLGATLNAFYQFSSAFEQSNAFEGDSGAERLDLSKIEVYLKDGDKVEPQYGYAFHENSPYILYDNAIYGRVRYTGALERVSDTKYILDNTDYNR